jgi:hypothetical protein
MNLSMLRSGAVCGELLELTMEYNQFCVNIEFCAMECECQEVGYAYFGRYEVVYMGYGENFLRLSRSFAHGANGAVR